MTREGGAFFLLLAVLLFSCGCKKKPEIEGYRVVGYDGASSRYTIIRNGTFDGKYIVKRLAVRCNFYKWADHEAVSGPTACNLRVGQMLVWNGVPKDPRDFLDIWEMPPDTLVITQGDGPDQVQQQFTILKEEVINN